MANSARSRQSVFWRIGCGLGLGAKPDDDAARRTFDAVERLITDADYTLGDPLAAEFIEVVWDHPHAASLMGDATRQRARPG